MILWQRVVHIHRLNEHHIHVYSDAGSWTVVNVAILRRDITDRRTGSAYILFVDADMATHAISENQGQI